MTSRTVSVFEWDTLTTDDGRITAIELDALVDFHACGGHVHFALVRNGVRFANSVGVIGVGPHLTIEVLPKTDRAEKKEVWRDVLLHMLHECRWLRVDAGDLASLREKKLNLLETYLHLFLKSCERLLHEGLVKKYRREEANATALKGKLLFAQNLRRNLVHAERFYIQQTVYDRDNLFNRILATALRRIARITADSALTSRAARLLLDWPELPDVHPTEVLFTRLRYDRKTERYRDAISIARMILLHYRPDIAGGAHSVLAVLFDMPSLWEAFVLHRLRRATMEKRWQHWRVDGQESRDFWQADNARQSARIRPDIVLQNESDGRTIILDTKWKLPDAESPSDSDLKQMFAYNRFWNCGHSALVFPSLGAAVHGRYHGDAHGRCSLIGVDVLKDGKLSAMMGEDLMDKVVGLGGSTVAVRGRVS